MFDLSTMTDAELGAAVRASLMAATASPAPAQRERIHAAREAMEADARAARLAERAGLAALPGFICKGVEVPALDVPALDLGEVAPARMRRPYNQARHRLHLEPLGTQTTQGHLVAEHRRLADMAQTAPVLAAEVSPATPSVATTSDQTRMSALVAVLGVDETTAASILAAL